MGNRLYVGNLDFQTTTQDLIDLLVGAGEVTRAQVITDRETQRSKGFAFIDMATEEEALKAISLYNGHVLNGRALQVSEARPREDRAGIGESTRFRNASPTKFREIKHKQRGGRKARPF